MALCSVVFMVEVPLKNSGRGKAVIDGLHFPSILEPHGGQLGVKIEGRHRTTLQRNCHMGTVDHD